MRFGILVFPGTWSDTDCYHVVKDILQEDADYVWHQEDNLSGYDCLVIPGGSPTATICVPEPWPGFHR